MREIVKLEVAKLRHGPKWIRNGKVEQAAIESLAASLKSLGQQVPIVARDKDILDGNCRFLAATLAGLTHLDAIVLDHDPTDLELLEIQYAIDARRSSVPTTQRAATLATMHQLLGCSVTQLAARTGDGQSMTTKLLAVAKATDAIKTLLDEGKIDLEKAYMLSQAPDTTLVEQASTLSREQLRQKIKSNGKPAAKASSIRLTLPPGSYVVTLKGPEFSMDTLLQLLLEASKQLKRAISRGHDLDSVEGYLRRSAKPQPPQ